MTLQPGPEGKDAFVAQMNGGMNYGSNTALASGQGPDFGGSEKRTLLQFDISSIPAGATVNSATLSLYVSQAAGGAQTASAYKVTSTWDESAVNWSNQPSSDATAVNSVAVNSVGWKSWTITSLVASWCNGSVTNNGVLVKQSSGSPPNNVQFYSSDYGGDATLRPKLVVDYTTVNNPPTAVSLNAPTNITDTTIALSWSQNGDADFQSYKLYRSTTPGVTEASTLVSSIQNQASSSYTDTGLAATTIFYYRVFVFDTGALSSGSNEIGATTASPPPPAPSVANLSVAATPTSIVADGAAQSTITATLTDVNNQPVADHAVNFTTSTGTLSAASATSNAQGNATVTLTSGTTAGTANIVSTSSGLTGTCSVTFTAVPPPPAPTLTLGANPSTLLADGVSQSTITATLMDGNNQPMVNETINFQTTAGTLSPTTGTTNAQGIATATLTSGTQAANVTITATSSNATGTCSVTFTTSSPPPSSGISIVGLFPGPATGSALKFHAGTESSKASRTRESASSSLSHLKGITANTLANDPNVSPQATPGKVSGAHIPVVFAISVPNGQVGPTGYDFIIDGQQLVTNTTQGLVERIREGQQPGEESIRIWKRFDKTEPIISFPYVIPTADLSATYYVEGVKWDKARVIVSLKQGANVVAEDTARLYSGILGIGLPADIMTTEKPFVGVTGIPDGAPVKFEVYKNGAFLQTITIPSGGGASTHEVDTSSSATTPGDIYHVVAKADLDTLVLTSDPCRVIPGVPYTITPTLSKTSLVADNIDTLTLSVVVKDYYGNTVEDGTAVQFVIFGSVAGKSNVVSEQTLNGGASTVLTAPLAVDFEVRVLSGGAATEVTIPVNPISGYLTAVDSTLNIEAGETTTIELVTNAQDDTPVYWTVSNYAEREWWNVFFPWSSRGAGTFTTTVSNGTSSIEVSSAHAKDGPCYISATVGGKIITTSVDFYSATPLRIRIARPVLVGEINVDGLATFQVMGDIVGGTGVTAVANHTVKQFARTSVHVWGAPNSTYSISLDDSTDEPLLQIADSSGTAIVQITTDNAGEGEFFLASKGAYNDPNAPYLHDVDFTVTNLDLPGQTSPGRIHLVSEKAWKGSLHTIASFFGADPTSPSDMVANAAGGVLIVGDIGTVVKNCWRMSAKAVGLPAADPNYTELALTGIGLLTELGVGVGEIVDVPISALRGLVAYLGQCKYAENLVLILKRLITEEDAAGALTKFTAYVKDVVKEPDVAGIGKKCWMSRDLAEASIHVHSVFGMNWVNALKSVVGSVSDEAISKATKVLKNLEPEVSDVIKNSSIAQEALQGLIRALDFGIDGEVLELVLKNENLYTAGSGYTKAHLLKNLGIAAQHIDPTMPKQGLRKLLNYMKSSTVASQLSKGRRYELDVIAKWMTDNPGTSGALCSKYVRVTINDVARVTDVDLQVGTTYFNVKSSLEELKDLGAIEEWMKKVKVDGAGDIMFASPVNFADIPVEIRNALKDLGKNHGFTVDNTKFFQVPFE